MSRSDDETQERVRLNFPATFKKGHKVQLSLGWSGTLTDSMLGTQVFRTTARIMYTYVSTKGITSRRSSTMAIKSKFNDIGCVIDTSSSRFLVSVRNYSLTQSVLIVAKVFVALLIISFLRFEVCVEDFACFIRVYHFLITVAHCCTTVSIRTLHFSNP